MRDAEVSFQEPEVTPEALESSMTLELDTLEQLEDLASVQDDDRPHPEGVGQGETHVLELLKP